MVFMMNKQFSGDQRTFGTAELSKPPPLDCPRCGSMNTKFCYYNNYNKSQPRHFCKSCKRHWTKGGTLRNLPAGRRRKNKRPRTSTASAAAVAPSEPRQKHFQNLLSLSTDQKNMSNILYQALMDHSSIDCTILESNGTIFNASSAPQNSNAEFTISNFNYQSSNDDYVVNFAENLNLDSTEESTVTTSAAPPWTAVNPSTAAVDVADLWNWNEIDFSGDHYAAWDHFKGY
ncbi:hypothetical protein C2S51_015215 [Perilla frutescens var. frutescens]|nr:hypothetical protein C2S51_015215 [Perilla frutescens var. frutescens]